ncbi:hypothetical protein E2C01_077545 [Portunus trituberculatus]|uniref:Uncharacterized protein n=1 Tax=Portunus trituberculatus TaxID=210409 RepID=A0A5B7IPZ4_PORTR|nr:hypothetical protein [Portunus trituberculatus]
MRWVFSMTPEAATPAAAGRLPLRRDAGRGVRLTCSVASPGGPQQDPA